MYGVSVVCIPLECDKFRYALMGGFGGMNWFLAKHKKDPQKFLKKLNAKVKKDIEKLKDNITSKERLLTAPCDSIIILGEDSFESLKERNPINCSKGTGREGLNITDYLSLEYDDPIAKSNCCV